jgi:hypothetical protein
MTGVSSPLKAAVIHATHSPSRGVWRPTSVPNLDLWFNPESGFTVAAGAISQWNDQSGNARNAAQGTGAAQPTQVTNGYLAAQADGGDDLLDADYNHSLVALTGFFAVRVQSVATNQSFLAHWDTNAQRSFKFGVNASKVNFRTSNGGTTIEKDYSGGTTVVAGAVVRGVFTYNAGTIRLWVNGVEETLTKSTDLAQVSIFNSTAAVTLLSELATGAVSAPALANTQMYDAGLYSAVLSDTDIGNLNDYLRRYQAI